MTRTGWRIVPAETAATAFDGEGARLYGGRWNPPGVAIVYASEHQSLAALEVRVHIEKTRMAKPYTCFAFHFDESLMEFLPVSRLPKRWREEPPSQDLQQIGADWVRKAGSVVLAVPSVIVPQEMNYLVNPKHPAFGQIKIDPPTRFDFDQRLFR